MPNLSFEVVEAGNLTYAVAPMLNLKVLVTNADADESIQSVMLRCQIQIETTRRKYSPDEQSKMLDLFGEPERWGKTLKTLLWTHTSMVITQFDESTTVEMPVPCTFDFNVATTKYFDALDSGEIPLCLLFSGTIFYYDSEGSLQTSQISWEKEANFGLPISVWKDMMDHYYPNSAWLNIRKDVFDRMQGFKMRNSIPSWEEAFERLLELKEESVSAPENGSIAEFLN